MNYPKLFFSGVSLSEHSRVDMYIIITQVHKDTIPKNIQLSLSYSWHLQEIRLKN